MPFFNYVFYYRQPYAGALFIVFLAQGLKNKEIAYRLGITEGTVKVYLSRLYGKLGVNDRFDLALFALKNLGPSQPAASAKLTAAQETMAPIQMPSTFRVGSTQIH